MFPNLSASPIAIPSNSTIQSSSVESRITTQLGVQNTQNQNSFRGTAKNPRNSETEINCLTKAIFYEARDQSDKGKFAIADVTLNRVENPEFPKSVCGVIRQPGQFSWRAQGKIRKSPDFQDEWNDAKLIAKKAVEHRNSVVSKGTLYFHADYVRPPKWTRKLKRVARIDDHIFYAIKKM